MSLELPDPGLCAALERTLNQAESCLEERRIDDAVQALESAERRLFEAVTGAWQGQRAGVAGLDRSGASALLRRTGEILSRCEMMRDRTLAELLGARAQGRFQDPQAGQGVWFSERA